MICELSLFNDNPCTYFVHCFAHQLMLVLVKVVERHVDMDILFDSILGIMNCVLRSSKQYYLLQAKDYDKLQQELELEEITKGTGLNQLWDSKDLVSLDGVHTMEHCQALPIFFLLL